MATAKTKKQNRFFFLCHKLKMLQKKLKSKNCVCDLWVTYILDRVLVHHKANTETPTHAYLKSTLIRLWLCGMGVLLFSRKLTKG